jgi:chemotaxis response regulator CheB
MPLSCPDRPPPAFPPIRADLVSICVVAEEATGRAKLKNIFSRSGELRCARSFVNVDKALTGKSTSNPQIVLLNVEPRGTEGLECLRQLVSGLSGTNVLILTAVTQVEWSKESLAADRKYHGPGKPAASVDRQGMA